MAAATATLTVNAYPYGEDNTQRRQILHGTVALSSGGTYVTNGIPLNWSTLVDGNFPPSAGKEFIPNFGSGQTKPQDAFFYSTTLAAPNYAYTYDKVNNSLRIVAGGTELTTAAVPTPDTIAFEAEFIRSL